MGVIGACMRDCVCGTTSDPGRKGCVEMGFLRDRMAKTKLCWMAVVIAAMGIQASCGSGDGQDREAARCEEEERLAVPGWKLNRDWSCACRLFDPEPGTQLPDWGTWEKCPTLGPKNVDCRMIVPPPEAADASRSSRLMDVHEISGRVTLALTDATRNGGVVTRLNYMVFDADGPTRSAMIQDMGGEDRCDVRWAEMNEGKLALHVFGKNARGSYDGMERTNQAVLGGDPDGPLARLIHKWDPKPLAGWTMSVSVSSDLLVTSTREGGFVAADWATMRWHEVIPDDDDSETDSYDTVEGLTTLGAVNGADPGGAKPWSYIRQACVQTTTRLPNRRRSPQCVCRRRGNMSARILCSDIPLVEKTGFHSRLYYNLVCFSFRC